MKRRSPHRAVKHPLLSLIASTRAASFACKEHFDAIQPTLPVPSWLITGIGAVFLLGACRDREEADGKPRRERPSLTISATPEPPRPASSPWFVGEWSGAYTAARHEIESQARQFAWMKDDGTRFQGTGQVEITIDANQEARGLATGPLGKLTLRGSVEENQLTMHVAPKSLTLDAFSGTARCTRESESARFSCTLHAATGDGDWVRRGSATLTRVASSSAGGEAPP